MKKKVVAMLLTVAAVASLGGCGKKEAETVNTTAEVVEIAPVEASESVVVEVPEGGLNADGEYIFVSELYAGRQAVRGNLAHMLAIGEKPLVQSDLPAEKSYFDFLEENWIDASWNDASYAESDVLHENVIAAVKSGIIDRTQATIADYKEIESKMAIAHWMMPLPAIVEVCRMTSVFCRRNVALAVTSSSGVAMMPTRLTSTPNSLMSGSVVDAFAAKALRLSTKAVTPTISWGTRTMSRADRNANTVRKAKVLEPMRRACLRTFLNSVSRYRFASGFTRYAITPASRTGVKKPRKVAKAARKALMCVRMT